MKHEPISARLVDLPVFERRDDVIAAHFYNHARLALKRLGNPLRLSLEGLSGLELVIEEGAWICIDRTLNDMPVMAWMGFGRSDRLALHSAVHCELRFYHCHASVIRDRVLEITERYIAERLAQMDG